ARRAAAARLPHGEHVAVLQLQRHQLEQGVLTVDHHFAGRVDLCDLELLRNRIRAVGGRVRRQRHSNSRGRRAAATAPAQSDSICTRGAPDWLGTQASRWWAAIACWDEKFATSSRPRNLKSICGFWPRTQNSPAS